MLGKRLLLDIVGKVLVVDYPRFERRLGLVRVSLGFAHSIHLGVICSLAVANVYYLHRDRFLRSLRVTGFVLFMLFLALSSGPMLSAAVQIAMIGWDRTLRFIRGHWMIGVFAGVVTLAVLQLALTGGLVGYMVNEVIFNSYGGNNRIAIWQYGSAEVLRHPLFGIGLGDWRRPFWQNATVDNFWLLIAMRHGLPAFVFLALAIAVSSARIMRQPGLDPEETRCRTGYLVALTGLVISLATVHVWQAAGRLRHHLHRGGRLVLHRARGGARHPALAGPRRGGCGGGRPARPARPGDGSGRRPETGPPAAHAATPRPARYRAAARPARDRRRSAPKPVIGSPMFETFRKLIDLLTPPEKRRFYLLLGMIMVMGLAEMVSVASILPFLAVLADPGDHRDATTRLARVYAALGFADHQSFLIFLGVGVFVLVVVGLLFSTLTQYAHLPLHLHARLLDQRPPAAAATCTSPTPGFSTATAPSSAPRCSPR